ncbi:hypothetical protein C0993_005314 [Termitomyces sp. T159_Od127]|nr:hypothetical protein C0993_005314 [Termitomyces sp. T159_Od127]
MDVTSSLSALGILQTPPSTRLLASACCPDKDLIVLISRLGGRDRLGLWNYSHGSKVWEVDVGVGDEGQSIVAVHNPPLVTLHSLQDGTRQFTLPLHLHLRSQSCKIVGVWWFRDARLASTSSIPDILRRNGVITGTAHSILRTLPLLDALQDDSQRLTATDLFAFQGTHTKAISKEASPSVIDEWSTLPSDPLSTSISTPLTKMSANTLEESKGQVDNINVNSLLVFADSGGLMHYYLDGTFPLGTIAMGSDLFVNSLIKDRTTSTFIVYYATKIQETIATSLHPIIVDAPLLDKRYIRDMAKLSSTARELVWYCMNTVKEMHETWVGSETFDGARHLGSKWIQALEAKQKDHFGQIQPNAILDLTTLLVTGRATDSVLDFLGSGEQMSERGILKWESTMTEALAKLRDYSEKRITPACQRLHLVLEEIQGWAQLSVFAPFELSLKDINTCLEMTMQMIVLSAWLAATARQELFRFKAFLHWLRFETSAANPSIDNAPQPRHDILEVNNYFISGLVTSPIDQWFTGLLPRFSLRDFLGENDQSILDVVEQARTIAKGKHTSSGFVCVMDVSLTDFDSWPNQHPIFPKDDLNFTNKNLNALVNELATRCKCIFDRAASAATRSATKRVNTTSAADLASRTRLLDYLTPSPVRERTTNVNEVRLHPPGTDHIYNFITGKEALESPSEIGIVLLEPFLMGNEEPGLDLLEADFLDDDYVLPKTRKPIERTRGLKGGTRGRVSLALNGRLGRRVACVLDGKGTLESFDMEGDEDEEAE